MLENSDQFASPEEEAGFHEEIIGTDSQVENQEDDQDVEAHDESEEEAEKVKPKKTGYVEITDPAVKARVDELTRKMHAERKEKEAAYRELQQYKKEPEPPKEVPPPSADPVTDPDVYRQQWSAREQYIKDQVKFESESQQRKQQIDAANQAKMESVVAAYNKNIERLNLRREDVSLAEKTVVDSGIGREIADFLLEDEDGPAIVKYLHNNPDVLGDLTLLPPTKAAAFIERNVRSKINVKPISKAPPPPTKVSGTRQSTAPTADGWEIS